MEQMLLILRELVMAVRKPMQSWETEGEVGFFFWL